MKTNQFLSSLLKSFEFLDDDDKHVENRCQVHVLDPWEILAGSINLYIRLQISHSSRTGHMLLLLLRKWS